MGRRVTLPRIAALLLGLAMAGCHGEAKAVRDAAPPPDLKAKKNESGARAKDPLWQRALDGDRVDLSRLADREGASGLVDGLEEGGPIGLTALASLPYAEDAELAYRRLGEAVALSDPDDALPFVETILALASRRRRQTEPLDPPGMRSSADALLEVARNKSAPARTRAASISALRMLSESGAVQAAAIPTDLDMK
jgi:hypothetical protein